MCLFFAFLAGMMSMVELGVLLQGKWIEAGFAGFTLLILIGAAIGFYVQEKAEWKKRGEKEGRHRESMERTLKEKYF